MSRFRESPNSRRIRRAATTQAASAIRVRKPTWRIEKPARFTATSRISPAIPVPPLYTPRSMRGFTLYLTWVGTGR